MSEAFKRRIGLIGGGQHDGCANEILDETIRELGEISLPQSHDVEREATLTRAKFDKFAKSFFQSKNSNVFSKQPINEPLLAKKHELDTTVSANRSAFVRVSDSGMNNLWALGKIDPMSLIVCGRGRVNYFGV